MTRCLAFSGCCFALSALASVSAALAGDRPYFITYDQTMEEPGNLEIELEGLTASPKDGNQFLSGVTEFEYGAKGWWTTEFYLDGQTTANQSTIFTGFRWENRFRLLMHEHIINPVFYIEYEDTNGADKSLIEVVGFDSQYDGLVPNKVASRDRQRELETKLILSSNLNGWNIAENFIAEKNLAGDPWEFGYAAAVSRPAVTAGLSRRMHALPRELSGGRRILRRTRHGEQVHGARHVAVHRSRALLAGWQCGVQASPTFGLTDASYRAMLRFGVQYEISGFRRKLEKLFH